VSWTAARQDDNFFDRARKVWEKNSLKGIARVVSHALGGAIANKIVPIVIEGGQSCWIEA
jgi:hypothetical protein